MPSGTLPQFTSDSTFCPKGKKSFFSAYSSSPTAPSWEWEVVEMKVGEPNKKDSLSNLKTKGTPPYCGCAPNVYT